MKCVNLLLIIMLCFSGYVVSQEHDSLAEIPAAAKYLNLSGHVGIPVYPEHENSPALFPDFNGIGNPYNARPINDFQSQKKWKISISAGFTIQSYEDPMYKNRRMGNSAIFP
jgi:hypothetical protein